jgi:hypothetical protein
MLSLSTKCIVGLPNLHDKRHMTWDVKICKILLINKAGQIINQLPPNVLIDLGD